MGPTRILTKDGGFGTQMTVHVGNSVDGDPLWSARFNATNPAAVINTHLDFLQSKRRLFFIVNGSTCINNCFLKIINVYN